MPPTAYLAPPKPISLQGILEASTSKAQAPSIDLQWDPFQRHVEAFLTAIDAYTLAAKTEIAARATDHVAAVRDAKAEKEEAERRIQHEREREGEMLATLENERHVLSDLTSSLNRLQTNLSKVKEQSALLESELNTIRKEVKSERAEKERQSRMLDEMRDRDGVELVTLEDAVGWRVEGIKQDLLLMRFTLIDPSDPSREFSILIDVSKQEYSVPNCDPPLPSLPEMVRQLNDDREFFTFIKKVRKAFRSLVPNPPSQSSKFNELSGPQSLRTPGVSRLLSASTSVPARTPGAGGQIDGAMEGLQLTS